MLGPFLRIAEFLGGEVGRKLGRMAMGDFKRWEQIPGWSHADKIADLGRDRGLSPEYLKGLVEDSTSKEHLQAIEAYLQDSIKTTNLSGAQVERLAAKIHVKLSAIHDQEALRQVLDAVREHGETAVDYLVDWVSH